MSTTNGNNKVKENKESKRPTAADSDEDTKEMNESSEEETPAAAAPTKAPVTLLPSAVDKPADAVQLDLGNLMAYQPLQFEKGTMGGDSETFLRELARDNTQILMNSLFGLPNEALPSGYGEGRFAVLPTPSTVLPREKPVPKLKELTKWEKFAAEKGIVKKKRSRMVYDELYEEYRPRWGYKKANDESKQWAIEHKEGADTTSDPWSEMKKEKKARVDKNKKNQLSNIKAAMGKRVPGQMDLTAVVEKKSLKRNQQGKDKKEKSHVEVALGISQKSTASMGTFDRVTPHEGAIKPDRPSRTNETELARSVAAEKKQSMAVLNKLIRSEEPKDDTLKPEKAMHRAAIKEAKAERPGKKKGQGKGVK